MQFVFGYELTHGAIKVQYMYIKRTVYKRKHMQYVLLYAFRAIGNSKWNCVSAVLSLLL